MSKAIMPLTDYQNTCESIRQKTGSTDTIKSGDMPKKINEVYEAGEKSQYDLTWDLIQNYGNPTIYNGRFQSIVTDKALWDAFYKPKYDYRHSDIYSPTSAFKVKVMTDMIKDNYVEGCELSYTFYQCFNLENARTLYINENTKYINTFNECNKLKEIRIVGLIGQNGFNVRWSTTMSKESITSIVNALSPTTSGLTVTLSKTAKENAFTDSEWATLIATKSNWNIALA